MTHSETHLAIRAALRGTQYRTFSLVVESVEVADGGVLVEWRVGVFAESPYGIHVRTRNPTDLLVQLREQLEDHRVTDPPPPPDLVAVGNAPSPRGPQ